MEESERKNVEQNNQNEQMAPVQPVSIQQNIQNQQINYVPQVNVNPALVYYPSQYIIYQQPYIQPVPVVLEPQIQNNYIMINQPVNEKEKKLPKYSTKLKCPFCNQEIETKIDKKFNYLICIGQIFLSFLIIFLIFFLLFGGCFGQSGNSCNCCCSDDKEKKKEEENKEKDGCCKNCCDDVTHICPNCGKIIGESKAELC